MRELPHDRRAYFPSALLRNALAPHCCDFGWLISGRPRFTAVPRLGDDGFQNFRLQFMGRCNYSWTTFWTTASCFFVYNCRWQHYSWTFSFTIACSNITIGLRFGLRLLAFSFTIACGNAALLIGKSRFSRKPFPRIALENRLRGPLMDLKNHLMKAPRCPSTEI